MVSSQPHKLGYELRSPKCKVHNNLMMNPIVGQCVLYVVQKVYAVHVMICKRVLIEKVLCMYLVGLLWVCTIILCTISVLLIHVEDSTYRVTE